jgi:hypothetical protein
MIDWLQVAFHALWILGCAVILTAFSYHNWRAPRCGIRTRQLLGASSFQFPFCVGLFLASLGLFFLSRGWLQHGLWAVSIVLFGRRAWELRKSVLLQ